MFLVFHSVYVIYQLRVPIFEVKYISFSKLPSLLELKSCIVVSLCRGQLSQLSLTSVLPAFLRYIFGIASFGFGFVFVFVFVFDFDLRLCCKASFTLMSDWLPQFSPKQQVSILVFFSHPNALVY